MKNAKLTPELAVRSETSSPGDEVEVIVQVTVPPIESGAGTRAARIAARRSSFEQHARHVEDAIGELEGKVLDRAWLSASMRVLVPAGRLRELARLDDVERIDVPRRLDAESPASG